MLIAFDGVGTYTFNEDIIDLVHKDGHEIFDMNNKRLTEKEIKDLIAIQERKKNDIV